MNLKKMVLLVVGWLLLAGWDPPPSLSMPATLTAFHRSGQTFLTWSEDTTQSGERYHVYQAPNPITTANLAQATRLTETWGPLPEGSSNFYTDWERIPEPEDILLYPGLHNYVIEPLGSQLAETTGVFVWTSHEAGVFYYAVTLVQADDTETLLPANSLVSPITETVADPTPVLVWQSPSGLGRVYTQFMDYGTFNPTYERPHAHPDGGLQYAYNYFVGVPTADLCGGTRPASLPVLLNITGYGARYYTDIWDGNSAPYYCALTLSGDDPRQSWYFGFSATYDYRLGILDGTLPDSGPIVNYTEERLLRMVYDTLRDPEYAAYALDANRVYVYGHSMGGSGALALGMRYPNVFAAAYSSEPMTNYQTAGDGGGINWREDGELKWGRVSDNLPVENRGRYATPLTLYNGTGVWDWQNHQQQLVARRGDDMAFISLAHGTLDEVIEWATQGQPGYAPFYQGLRAFSGLTVNADHIWLEFNGLGPNTVMVDYQPFYGFTVIRDETVPALTHASGSSPVPPAGADAAYNLNLEWSASWNAWDGAPVDTMNQWQISLRTTDGMAQTVEVTPRRVQNFVVTPGGSYRWENRRVQDNELVASGLVVATEEGLLTVPDFAVSPTGNRLVILGEGTPAIYLPLVTTSTPPAATEAPTASASAPPSAPIPESPNLQPSPRLCAMGNALLILGVGITLSKKPLKLTLRGSSSSH
jgi:pimeloyl-ACP methyl ester carboxylesterase